MVYLRDKVEPVLGPLRELLLREKPVDVFQFLIDEFERRRKVSCADITLNVTDEEENS